MRIKKISLVILLLMSMVITLMPAGLCPCWLMIDPAIHHPHFDSLPGLPHSHWYLLDYFKSQTPAVTPTVIVSIAAWLAVMAAGRLWRPLAVDDSFGAGWEPSVDLPPPRFAA